MAIFATFYGAFLARFLADLNVDHYGAGGEGWEWFVLACILTLAAPIFLLVLGQFTRRRLIRSVVAVHAVCLGIYLLERYW